VSELSDADHKKYKKLKNPQDTQDVYFKVSFLKEALVKGGLTDYDLDSDDENDDKGGKSSELDWYFECGSLKERNQVIS
jgi:hypothetical protein